MNHASLLTLLALISVITYLRVAHLTWVEETRNILLNNPIEYSENPPTYTARDTTDGEQAEILRNLHQEFCEEQAQKYTLNKLPQYLEALQETPSPLKVPKTQDGMKADYSPGIFRTPLIMWIMKNVLPVMYKTLYWAGSPFIVDRHAKRYKEFFNEKQGDAQLMIPYEGRVALKYVGSGIKWGLLFLPSAVLSILFVWVWLKLREAYVDTNYAVPEGAVVYQPAGNEPYPTYGDVDERPLEDDGQSEAAPKNQFEDWDAPTQVIGKVPPQPSGMSDSEPTVHIGDPNAPGLEITHETYSSGVDAGSSDL